MAALPSPARTRAASPGCRIDLHQRLARLLGGAHTEHAQLEALASAARAEIGVPVDALVVGEPVQVTAIDTRAGFVAASLPGFAAPKHWVQWLTSRPAVDVVEIRPAARA